MNWWTRLTLRTVGGLGRWHAKQGYPTEETTVQAPRYELVGDEHNARSREAETAQILHFGR